MKQSLLKRQNALVRDFLVVGMVLVYPKLNLMMLYNWMPLSLILHSSVFWIQSSQTKGCKRESRGKEVASISGRIKSGIEMATQGRKRLCRFCQKLVNHDKRNCPLNPNRKRRKQLTISEDDEEEEDDMDTDDDDD